MEHLHRSVCFLSFSTALIENVHFGVLGCLHVSGGSDVSVVIRSAMRWDYADGAATANEALPDERTVHAGGATSLSTEIPRLGSSS